MLLLFKDIEMQGSHRGMCKEVVTLLFRKDMWVRISFGLNALRATVPPPASFLKE